MRRPGLPDDERLLDLLAERAARGLTDGQEAELRRLLEEHPGLGPEEFDLAAAEVHGAFAALREATDEPLPEGLRAKILNDAESHLPAPREFRRPVRRAWYRSASAGWLAAAAMLFVALLFALRGPTAPAPVSAPSVVDQRRQLIEGSTDLIQVAWAPPSDPEFAGVQGDVVWSNESQTGFMRLRGLPANEPSAAQYQLWIVDPTRDEKPIDGGVFDVPPDGDEAVIPIDAKLIVRQPAAFAITLEQPGGVVVSDGPLLVVAAVQS